jgi:type VI protein secretion system component Hcp
MVPSSISVVSTDAPVSAVDSTNSTTSTNSPSFYPTYFPTTSNTTSPTFYEASTATTTTEAATNGTSPGGFDCTTEFCEYQLSDAYLMEYRLNVPEGESIDQCQTCSLSVRLTYEGEAWLGFALK